MFRGLVGLALMTLTAACASPSAARPGSGDSGTSGAAQKQRVGQDLARYDRAVAVAVAVAGHGAVLHPVGPLPQ